MNTARQSVLISIMLFVGFFYLFFIDLEYLMLAFYLWRVAITLSSHLTLCLPTESRVLTLELWVELCLYSLWDKQIAWWLEYAKIYFPFTFFD